MTNSPEINSAPNMLKLRKAIAIGSLGVFAFASSSYTFRNAEGVPIQCLDVKTPDLNPDALEEVDGDISLRPELRSMPQTPSASHEQFGDKPIVTEYGSTPVNLLRSLVEAWGLDSVAIAPSPKMNMNIVIHYSSDANYEIPISDTEGLMLYGMEHADYIPNIAQRHKISCFGRSLIEEQQAANRTLHIYFAERAESVYYKGRLVNIDDVPSGDRKGLGLTMPRIIDGNYHMFIAPGLNSPSESGLKHRLARTLGHEAVHLGQYVKGVPVLPFKDMEQTGHEHSNFVYSLENFISLEAYLQN